jgi:uncharacterized protein (TIGR03000 family)
MRRILLLSIIPAVVGVLLSRADAQPGAKSAGKATVVVHLPTSAKLFVQDSECPLKSDTRRFSTSGLEPGKNYEYNLRAEVARDNKVVGITLRVPVKAGETINVQFGDEQSMLAAGGLAPAPAPVVPPVPTPNRTSGFPAGPAPWIVSARIDAFDKLFWYAPEDGPNARSRGSIPDGEYSVRLASGAELTPAQLTRRLQERATVVISTDAKPIDPFYLNLIAPDVIVVTPKKPFPDQARPPAPTIVFALAEARANRSVRLRWQSVTSTGPVTEPSDANPGGEVALTRWITTEYAVEFKESNLNGYDSAGRALTATQVAALVKQDTPVVLLDAGRKPKDLALTDVLKKDVRVLVLPVGFRAP